VPQYHALEAFDLVGISVLWLSHWCRSGSGTFWFEALGKHGASQEFLPFEGVESRHLGVIKILQILY
jgi:hypothetical protein